MSTNNFINNLLRVNNYICSQGILWNQGQGGNVSVKLDNDQLCIKPSGFRLSDLKNMADFVSVNFKKINYSLNELVSSNFDEITCEARYSKILESSKINTLSTLRPSMELGFHSVIPSRFVMHFHSILCLLLLEKPCTNFLSKLKSKFPIEEIGYFTPGFSLTKKLMNQNFDKKIFLLKNHGVILHFDDIDDFEIFQNFHNEVFLGLNSIFQTDISIVVNKIIDTYTLPAYFKHFFPDAAIVESQIRNNLIENPDNTYSVKTNSHSSRNALENWQAIQIIQQIFPDCETLSSVEVLKLIKLPTEIARIKQMENL